MVQKNVRPGAAVLLGLKAVRQRYIKKYGALSLLHAPNVSIVLWYVCMYCMYAVCMYVCSMCVCVYACMRGIHVCMYVYMYVWYIIMLMHACSK
jgi:hypothetical protein